ncbi:MAG: tyrosine decarboxylase MfnA [Candidatus Thermoplasmatota archaeon]
MKTEKKINQIINDLKKYKKEDYSFSSGRILGSMCTTPLPIGRKAYQMFLESNLGDPELFLGSKQIENKLFDFYGKLLHAPKKFAGIIGSGGTESNINSIWIAKTLSKKSKILVPESAHFSFEKIASLMDIKTQMISLNSDSTVDVEDLKEKIDNKTAAVVGIAGTTELGAVDPIPDMGEICQDYNVCLHVDAAFGGYVLPFLKKIGYQVDNFDFQVDGVSSVSIDAHKMGCSAIPLGVLLVKNKEWLSNISVASDCVSSEKQIGILGTRSAGPVASAYAISEYLGFEGYQDIVENCMKNTFFIEEKLRAMGLELACGPTMNVIGVKMKKPDEIAKRLSEEGWKVNIMERISCLRLVIMPHIGREDLELFAKDFEKICREEDEI